VSFTVKQQRGVLVEYRGQAIVLDPTGDGYGYPCFITHGHADHAAAFKYPEKTKYATEETVQMLSAVGWKNLENFTPVKVGSRIKLDDIEIRVHNAGHVLGSVEYEVQTPEGSVLYTGDIGLGDSFTMKSAEPVECDLLVVETTFGAPMFSFPSRQDVALDMIRWATMEVIPQHKLPVFKTDSIGNAQEIIHIFNSFTKLPVVTAKSATKISNVYRDFGYKLNYTDYKDPEVESLVESGRCVIISPKGSKLPYEHIDPALASGWAVLFGGRNRAFPLSDHADFKGLIGFIRKCKPKRVLTFHGGVMTKDFPSYISKKLGIEAKPLTGQREGQKGQLVSTDNRIKACTSQVLRTIRIPGFEYTRTWLIKEMTRVGYNMSETEITLDYLVSCKVLVANENSVMLS
jgi:putative mRNA 3-end processing factor